MTSFIGMRIIVVCLLLFITLKSFSQEKLPHESPELANKSETSFQIATKIMEAIQELKNIAYLSEHKFTIPYMPGNFREGFISKNIISFNKGDTIQGGSFKFYILQDSFNLKSVYDSKYLVSIDNEGKRYVTDLSKDPFSAYRTSGLLHLHIKNLFESAIAKGADMTVSSSNDSLRIDIAFHNLQIEFAACRIAIEKDTIGFMSRYTVYLDKYTYLPIKYIRKMPYQTSIETILFQKPNFIDTLVISVHAEDLSVHQSLFESDSLLKFKLQNTPITTWNLMEVEGDSVRSSDLARKKYLLVFNSIGWKRCEQATTFLKQLKRKTQLRTLKLLV